MQTDKRIIEAAEKKYLIPNTKDNWKDAFFNLPKRTAFIEGIESPINQILKLEFAIELLKEINFWSDKANKLKDLQSQLEELKKQL